MNQTAYPAHGQLKQSKQFEKVLAEEFSALLSRCNAMEEALSSMMTFYGMDRDSQHQIENFIWKKAEQALANHRNKPTTKDE